MTLQAARPLFAAVLLILFTGRPVRAKDHAAGPVPPQSPWRLAAKGFSFPEGPAWDGEHLYVSNCYGNWIARITRGRVDTFLTASRAPFSFAKTNGLAVDGSGNLWACDFGAGAILRISPEGKSTVAAAGYRGKSFHRPNDLAFAPNGDLYFTDPNRYDPKLPDGRIFRLRADGSVHLMADSLAFPNGIAFSPDGSSLYVCESARHRVLRFPWRKDTLGDPEEFVELPGGDPDGINFDAEGNLYVAHFGGGAVYVISPEGNILRKIPAPGKKPTNLEFGGPDLRTLFLTEVETNAVYKLRVRIPGAALFHSPLRRKKN